MVAAQEHGKGPSVDPEDTLNQPTTRSSLANPTGGPSSIAGSAVTACPMRGALMI